MSTTTRTAIITGAGSGIGKATALATLCIGAGMGIATIIERV